MNVAKTINVVANIMKLYQLLIILNNFYTYSI